MMRTTAMTRYRMKAAAVIGGIAGFALFIVAWLSYHAPIHVIIIPLAAAIGAATVYLGDGPAEKD